MTDTRITVYMDGDTYRLTAFQAKELYFKLRDIFDDNFYPNSNGQHIKVVDHNSSGSKRK